MLWRAVVVVFGIGLAIAIGLTLQWLVMSLADAIQPFPVAAVCAATQDNMTTQDVPIPAVRERSEVTG